MAPKFESAFAVDPSPLSLSSRRRRPGRTACLALAAVLSTLVFLFTGASDRLGALVRPETHTTTAMVPATAGQLVPLEAHIMSKCPDARDCLYDLIVPAMQQIYEKTNFTLSFIGKPAIDDGVQCMHGPGECMGNIIELCAAKLYPDPKIYLGFTTCLFRNYQMIPEQSMVEDCALEHGIDIEQINACATRDDGQYGLDLLRHSVQRSIDAGVTYSCTVRLDEQIYCIRDSGRWKDCSSGGSVNDLIVAVERLWRQANE